MKQMRLSIAVVICALVAFVCSAVCGFSIYNHREAVTITEDILFGTRDTVANVSITQDGTWQNQLIWDTTIPLSDVAQAKTTLRALRERAYAYSANNATADIYFNLSMSSSTSNGFHFDEEELWLGYPLEMFQDVASRVPAGETYTETVRVADYGAYYTPTIRIMIPPSDPNSDSNGVYYSNEWEQNQNELTEYFKAPVGSDDMADVTMSADPGGAIYDVSVEPLFELGARSWLASALHGDRTVYLAQSAPEGVDLYCVQFAPVPEDKYGDFGVEDVCKVYTIEDDTCSEMNVYGDELFVRTGDETHEDLTIFSLPSMDVVQTIPLPRADGWNMIYYTEEFFVIHEADGSFLVYEPCDGQYAQVLEGNFATHCVEQLGSWYDVAMNYQDGTLVTMMREHDWELKPSYVAVNTAEGCIFTASYTSSLASAARGGNVVIRPWREGLERPQFA